MSLQKQKNPMSVQEPRERIKNFKEVALGYTPEEAINESLALPAMPYCTLCHWSALSPHTGF